MKKDVLFRQILNNTMLNLGIYIITNNFIFTNMYLFNTFE